MTKLQEEILQAIRQSIGGKFLNTDLVDGIEPSYGGLSIAEEDATKAASEVALRWIEKAFEAGNPESISYVDYEEWLEKNNLIEKQ